MAKRRYRPGIIAGLNAVRRPQGRRIEEQQDENRSNAINNIDNEVRSTLKDLESRAKKPKE